MAGGSLGALSGPDGVTADRNRSRYGNRRERKTAPRRKAVTNDDVLGCSQDDVVFWRGCCCAVALTSNLKDATRHDKSRKSKHDKMYVCVWSLYIARVRINRVRLPILLVAS